MLGLFNIWTAVCNIYCLVHWVDANMAVGVMHTCTHVHTHACIRICTCNKAQHYRMQAWKGCTWECCVLYIDCVTASVFKAILACFSAALISPRSRTGHALSVHSTVHNCITVLRDMYSMYRNVVYSSIGCIISILQFVLSFKVEYVPHMALCTNFRGMYKAPLLHNCKLPIYTCRAFHFATGALGGALLIKGPPKV